MWVSRGVRRRRGWLPRVLYSVRSPSEVLWIGDMQYLRQVNRDEEWAVCHAIPHYVLKVLLHGVLTALWCFLRPPQFLTLVDFLQLQRHVPCRWGLCALSVS